MKYTEILKKYLYNIDFRTIKDGERFQINISADSPEEALEIYKKHIQKYFKNSECQLLRLVIA